MDYNTFRKNILKVNKPREHEFTNSLGLNDIYKLCKSNISVDYKVFSNVIKTMNKYIAESLGNGEMFIIPENLGCLEIRKRNAKPHLDENGEYKITYTPDWKRTLELWYEDEEAKKNKTIIRMINDEVYKIIYNRVKAKFNNKNFIQFNINRNIKQQLKVNIMNNKIKAFYYYDKTTRIY